MVLHILRAQLRFEGITEKFRMAVEQALGNIAAVLIHGRNHDEFEILAHVRSPNELVCIIHRRDAENAENSRKIEQNDQQNLFSLCVLCASAVNYPG